MSLLITGTGRSGTAYISLVLKECNLDVGHEVLGKDGIVSWGWAPPNGTFLPKMENPPRFDVILHQVRSPLETIASLGTIKQGSWDWIYKHVPLNPKTSIIQRCAEAWFYWNQLAERRASWTYRVENLQQDWEEFKARTNIPKGTAFPDVPKTTNSRFHYSLTWDHIEQSTPLCSKIRELAEHYGYQEA